MSKTLKVGVIGCGNISSAYFQLSTLFQTIDICTCADIDMGKANEQAKAFNLKALDVESLLTDKSIDIIVNLTTPNAHYEVSKRALESGKHVYSEKPFVLELQDGLRLRDLAASKNLIISSSPDTFLGGAHQLARKLIDKGQVGEINSGTCHVMSYGMEHWHPDPHFFYKKGGGPVLDIGPYYVTNLINLLGPVEQVVSMSSIPWPERTITSEPKHGEKIKVETPTTIHGVLKFKSGALITLGTSWNVWHHNHQNMELYGEKGAIFIPDPNFFGGDVNFTNGIDKVASNEAWNHPLSIPNHELPFGKVANYRTVGLSEMADSIIHNRTPRCSIDVAIHAIDVMTRLLESAEKAKFIEMTTSCERPAPFSPEEAVAIMKTRS